jgi:signal transduction histidine kinase
MDINDVTRDVIALSQHELDRNRIVLRTDFADALPEVRGDRVQIQQVVLNLLLNAGDAMNALTDRARQALVRTELDANGYVRVTVADNGPGIDPLIADRLFEAFFSTKATGMGIGLSISRSIIEQHGGRLWLDRTQGPGASFCFSIPP